MKTKSLCPMCEKGELVPQTIDDEYCYKGQTYIVRDIEYADCPICDSEITTPEQIKRNEIKVTEAKRKLEGFLSATEIKELRERLNLTQEQAAKIFGGGANAFSKYERSEVMQSVVMDKLMRLALNVPQGFEYLCETSDVPVVKQQKFQYCQESKQFAELVVNSIQRNEFDTTISPIQLSPLQVARWFTHKMDRSAGDTLSPLKLQKLLYYFQSWHSVIFRSPLFDASFEAWCHGPVIPSVYYEYKVYGKSNIPEPEQFEFDKEPNQHQVKLMQLILNHYGELSALHLKTLAHQEYPWKNTRGDLPPDVPSNEIISLIKIKQYYGSLLQHTTALM